MLLRDVFFKALVIMFIRIVTCSRTLFRCLDKPTNRWTADLFGNVTEKMCALYIAFVEKYDLYGRDFKILILKHA